MAALLILSALLLPPVYADTGEQYSLDCITNAYGMVIHCEPVEPEPEAGPDITEDAVLEEPEPIEEEYCEEVWYCTGWSECTGGIRVRGCVVNECVPESGMPHTTEACVMPPEPVVTEDATTADPAPEPAPEPAETEPEEAPEQANETVAGNATLGETSNVTGNVTLNETVSEGLPVNATIDATIQVNATNATATAPQENLSGTGKESEAVFLNMTIPGSGYDGNETVRAVVCTPSETRCEGDRISVCSATGDEWFLMQRCEHGCVDGRCLKLFNSSHEGGLSVTGMVAASGNLTGGSSVTGSIASAPSVSMEFLAVISFLVIMVSGVAYFITKPKF